MTTTIDNVLDAMEASQRAYREGRTIMSNLFAGRVKRLVRALINDTSCEF